MSDGSKSTSVSAPPVSEGGDWRFLAERIRETERQLSTPSIAEKSAMLIVRGAPNPAFRKIAMRLVIGIDGLKRKLETRKDVTEALAELWRLVEEGRRPDG